MTVSDRDVDFRQLFAEEAAMRLARLSEQLLQLEQTGGDAELVASIFREAHTVKGAAAVVGVEEASQVAHALEDLLERVRSGAEAPSPGLVDVALAATDGLASMIPRLLAGEDCAAEAAALEDQVRTWSEGGTESPAVPEPPRQDLPLQDLALRDVPAGPSTSAAVASESDAEPTRPAADAPGGTPGGGPGGGTPSHPTGTSTGKEPISIPSGRLDELVRLVGESAAAHLRVGRMLTEQFGVDPAAVSEFRDLARVLNDLQERTMRVRMVPISTITDQLHRAVRDLSRSLGKDVHWDVRGDDTELDRGVLQHLADPLLHLVRNAVDHGVETPDERLAAGKDAQATVRLHAMQLGSEVIIAVTDDGRGIDVARVRDRAARHGVDTAHLTDEEALFLIFRSGLSTAESVSEISGRGVGLDIVHASVEGVRGRIEVRSEPGRGSEFRIIVPITLAVLPCLLVATRGQRYAIPMHSVTVSMAHDPARETQAEGRSLVWVGDTTVPVSRLDQTLGESRDDGDDGEGDGPIIVVAGVTRRHAFRVDALVGQREVVVKGLSRLLPRLDVLAGASVEPDGSILLVLDAAALIERARLGTPAAVAGRVGTGVAVAADRPAGDDVHGSIVVVDDALTVRELQRSILERAGFEVRLAADGVEALALLAEQKPDLVLTDVEMPRMDGFQLTETIRATPGLTNVPVLMLTSRASEADRARGLEAGADGYVVKSAFDEARLLGAVNGLLGRGA